MTTPHGPARLAGQRDRAVLAALAVDVGRAVPLVRLVDAVWADDPPPTAPNRFATRLGGCAESLGRPAIAARMCGPIATVAGILPAACSVALFTAERAQFAQLPVGVGAHDRIAAVEVDVLEHQRRKAGIELPAMPAQEATLAFIADRINTWGSPVLDLSIPPVNPDDERSVRYSLQAL